MNFLVIFNINIMPVAIQRAAEGFLLAAHEGGEGALQRLRVVGAAGGAQGAAQFVSDDRAQPLVGADVLLDLGQGPGWRFNRLKKTSG